MVPVALGCDLAKSQTDSLLYGCKKPRGGQQLQLHRNYGLVHVSVLAEV